LPNEKPNEKRVYKGTWFEGYLISYVDENGKSYTIEGKLSVSDIIRGEKKPENYAAQTEIPPTDGY
jgi:hypothetical protein